MDKRTHQHHHLQQLHGSCKQHSLTYFSLCNSKVNQQFIAAPKATIYLAIITQWLQTITSLLQRGYSHNHTVDTKRVYNPTVVTKRLHNHILVTKWQHNHTVVTQRINNYTVVTKWLHNHTVRIYNHTVVTKRLHSHTVKGYKIMLLQRSYKPHSVTKRLHNHTVVTKRVKKSHKAGL